MAEAVTISADGVQWSNYPFIGASVYPSGFVAWRDVRHLDSGGLPPEVWTADGETLFVPFPQKHELLSQARAVGIEDAPRVDVWRLLLEPFLDTEFTTEDDKRTAATLERVGIPARRIEQIRARVGPHILGYNSLVWDWVHLGLDDLLTAFNWEHRSRGLTEERRRRIYRWAMGIAGLGER